jgi:hypothetical protein
MQPLKWSMKHQYNRKYFLSQPTGKPLGKNLPADFLQGLYQFHIQRWLTWSCQLLHQTCQFSSITCSSLLMICWLWHAGWARKSQVTHIKLTHIKVFCTAASAEFKFCVTAQKHYIFLYNATIEYLVSSSQTSDRGLQKNDLLHSDNMHFY